MASAAGARPETAGGILHRHRRAASVLVGSGAAVAIMIGLLLLVSTGTEPVGGSATTSVGDGTVATLAETTGCCSTVPMPARKLQESMVSLLATKGSGVAAGSGVAIGPEGMVVTTFDEVTGAGTVEAVTADGVHVHAQVVATDRRSDVALLRVPTDLRSASFGNDNSISSGSHVTAMAMTSPPNDLRKVVTMWSNGTVQSIGSAVAGGNAAGMAGIDAVLPAMPHVAGELLLAGSGKVMGILDTSGDSSGSTRSAVFLPASLVLGVARDLADWGRIRHGWLDVVGRDTASQGIRGALVVKVKRGGASAHVLRPGDVIVQIDGSPVRSMAELYSRLYILGPGQTVNLEIIRDGKGREVAVTLSSSP
ncbi:MAG: PDZ domain-containing protein [Actinomycetota bacterium]|nr:PDZ domain-containing protein [Actinomycetota bacterium]